MEQNNHIQNTNEFGLILNDNGRIVHNPKAINDITILKNHYDISIEQINSSPILSKENKEVLLATLNFTKISELNIQKYDTSYNYLVGVFGKTIVESGIGMEEGEQEVFISLCIDEVINDFSYLTIEDVRIAVKKGVRLDYGKFYGLNITTLNFWLKEYVNSTKKDAMKLLPQINPKDDFKGLNDEQQKIIYKRWLDSWIDLFEKYHEGENITISDVGNVFYKYCIKNKIGSLTDRDKIILENKAKRLIIANGKEHASSTFQIKEINAIIEAINKNNYNKDIDLKIVSEAKRLAIFTFFDKLILEKLELRDLIDKIENKKGL
jgi:uncharacterized protein YeeX (DUF496 family)